MQKREELPLCYATTLTDSRLVDSAYAGPVQEPNVGIAFILGLAFPAGFIYAKESLKNTISNQEDIESITNAIVLSKVFHYNNYKEKNVFVSSLGDKTAETFRTLRTNINFAPNSSSHKTILVTSCLIRRRKNI